LRCVHLPVCETEVGVKSINGEGVKMKRPQPREGGLW